jgi:hypothetical protein
MISIKKLPIIISFKWPYKMILSILTLSKKKGTIFYNIISIKFNFIENFNLIVYQ